VAAKSPEAEATKPAVVDVNWDDDEDETTHIFDKAEDIVMRSGAAPVPAAGTPPPPAVAKNKVTLLGINVSGGPLPPPPTHSPLPTGRLTPPPGMPSTRPGMPQNPFTIPSSFPAPPAGALPPPPTTQQGLGNHASAPTPLPAPLEAPLTSPLPPTTMPPARRSHESVRLAPSAEVTALLRPRKPQSRATLWAASALVAALLIALVFLLIPQTGRLIVDVNVPKGASANHVDIFVDGRKQCDTAPCIIDPLSSGAHEVKVVADGYDTPPIQSVTIAARHDTSATFVLDMGVRRTELKVSGTQPGVKLYLDDKEIGPLPQDLRDIVAGEHVIKLVGSERYQPLEKHITFQADSAVDLGAVALRVSKGKATVTLATPGAHVYLTSINDRRELPMFPISVDIDTSKSWTLQASKPGFIDYSQAISFDDGQAEKTYAIELQPKVAAVTPPAWTPPPQAAAPAPAPAPAPVAAPRAAAAEGNGSEAYLNINSIPASTCYLDGRALGSTPKINVSVKPGTHTVKFVNTEQGLTKTVTVSVGAGETKPAVAKLN
jgi:serine/threonine-protein kinase